VIVRLDRTIQKHMGNLDSPIKSWNDSVLEFNLFNYRSNTSNIKDQAYAHAPIVHKCLFRRAVKNSTYLSKEYNGLNPHP
jgi:hypothetical protein